MRGKAEDRLIRVSSGILFFVSLVSFMVPFFSVSSVVILSFLHGALSHEPLSLFSVTGTSLLRTNGAFLYTGKEQLSQRGGAQ